MDDTIKSENTQVDMKPAREHELLVLLYADLLDSLRWGFYEELTRVLHTKNGEKLSFSDLSFPEIREIIQDNLKKNNIEEITFARWLVQFIQRLEDAGLQIEEIRKNGRLVYRTIIENAFGKEKSDLYLKSRRQEG